jgi:predicted ArsR family transcriptional regulator
MAVLARHGYEPEIGRRKEIALANCPFHRLAEQERELVCGMNLDFLSGLLEGLGPAERLTARLDPAPGYCCVRIRAA